MAENHPQKKKRMTGRFGYLLGALAVFITVGALFLLLRHAQTPREPIQAPERMDKTPSQPVTQTAANLYFSDKENYYLIAETRTLPRSQEPEDFGKVIVQALERGPEEGLTRTIPAGTRVRALYLAQGGTAVVDLSESISENHPGGCKTEILTIYSLVNSLVLNIPEIESVKILIGGREAMTLAGHVDLRFPFKANMLLIR